MRTADRKTQFYGPTAEAQAELQAAGLEPKPAVEVLGITFGEQNREVSPKEKAR